MKLTELTRVFLIIVFSTSLVGCLAAPLIASTAATVAMSKATTPTTTTEVEGNEQSTMEARAAQVKEFESGYNMAFRSSLDVLQDLGFHVQTTNHDTGLIAGMKQIPLKTTVSSTLGGSSSYSTFVLQAATVTVEKWTDETTRIRLVTDLDNTNNNYQVSAEDRARFFANDTFYQDFFTRVDKAIFIRRQNL